MIRRHGIFWWKGELLYQCGWLGAAPTKEPPK
jgi:hypothetical protein